MTAMRCNFQALFAGAGAALVVLSLSARAFAEGQSETNRGTMLTLVLDPNEVSEDARVPAELKAQLEYARLELAKQGEHHILGQIVGELVSPKDSPAFLAQTNHSSEQELEIAVRSRAFEKLAYIGSTSTIQVVASFLTDTTHPPSKPTDVRYVSYAEMAADSLSQIVSNPPPTATLSAQDKVRVWQQWWEQNKDKYP
jgi:hypothetical protein